MGANRHGQDPRDRELFLSAISGTVPLDDRERAPTPRPRAKIDAPAEGPALAVEENGETVSGRAEGVNRRVLSDLVDADPGATLDLHGLRLTLARDRLREFLAEQRDAGNRRVLVITGRGKGSENGPVLKKMATATLSQSPSVLAFVSAAGRLGGTGALSVLLRRKL